MSHAHTGNCRCTKPRPTFEEPIGCTCGPWSSITPPPPCPVHPPSGGCGTSTWNPPWYSGVHALERRLLRKLLTHSFLARADHGPRLYFDADWLDLLDDEAALLRWLEN